MFIYPELTTESHNRQRWYLTPNGLFYPSITTVLGGTESPEKEASLQNWRNSLGHAKAAAVTKAATDRGTNVHLLAERFLKGEDVDALIDGKPVPQADKASFNALKLSLRKIDQIWGQEVALYSEELEVAGRCDLAGTYKGVPVIVDFKTSSRIKGSKDIENYKKQLCFYARAHNEMHGTNIQTGIILMVSEAGFPQEFTIPLAEQLDGLKARVSQFWAKVLV